MTWTASELTSMLSAWFWPFMRIGAMLGSVPVFGAKQVPARVRLGLAVLVAALLVPVIPEPPPVAPLSGEGILVGIQQVLIGLAMGLALRLVFVVFELAGQIIAQHMALHFASMVDPNSGVQVPMLSQFYIILATLVLLSLNGHLLFLRVLAESFQVLPVASDGLGRDGLWHLVQQMGWVFSAAVMFALPAIGALLVVNLAFGVMTRAAPQLNIFAVGFPVTLVFGFFIMLLTLPHAVNQFEPLFEVAIGFLRQLVSGAL